MVYYSAWNPFILDTNAFFEKTSLLVLASCINMQTDCSFFFSLSFVGFDDSISICLNFLQFIAKPLNFLIMMAVDLSPLTRLELL